MARFENGWTKTYRNLDNNWVGKDGWAYAIFIRLISWANYEPTKLYSKGDLITIERGQLLTSVRELADSFRFDRSTVERRLQALEKDNMIVRKVRHRGTIITICNYDKYQCINDMRETDFSHTTSTTSATRPATPSALNKEVKNIRNKEVKNIPSANADFLGIAKSWLEFAQKEMPWKKAEPKWSIEGFALELEKVSRLSGVTVSGLEEILEFIRKDEFWAKNAVSPFGLLKKSSKNDLRKIDNIITKMRTRQSRMSQAIDEWASKPDVDFEELWIGKTSQN